MGTKIQISNLKTLLGELGAIREVMFDGQRYNSRHLYNLLEKWHGSDAYLTSEGHIKFDAGEGVYTMIQTGIVEGPSKVKSTKTKKGNERC